MEIHYNAEKYGVGAPTVAMLRQFACEALGYIADTTTGEPRYLSDGILKWWENHKHADRYREEALVDDKIKKRERKAALAKLSPAERRVLGV